MTNIITIQESLVNRIAELEAELSPLQDALDALIAETTTTKKVVKVTDKSPGKGTDEQRERMLANLEKARAARQANLATKQNGKKSRKGTTRRSDARNVVSADSDMTRAEEIMHYVEQGLTVPEIVEETGAHASYVYAVRRTMLAAA